MLEPPAPSRPSSALLWARGVVFAGFAIWLLVGPLVRGVYDQEQLKWIPRWEMFGSYGREICDVRYTQRHPDGSSTSIDWIDQLGRSREASQRRRNRIRDLPHALRVGRQLCASLETAEPDVRGRIRCGSRTTWKREEWLEHNLCELPSPKMKSRKVR